MTGILILAKSLPTNLERIFHSGMGSMGFNTGSVVLESGFTNTLEPINWFTFWIPTSSMLWLIGLSAFISIWFCSCWLFELNRLSIYYLDEGLMILAGISSTVGCNLITENNLSSAGSTDAKFSCLYFKYI